jgi:hypothetical protein
MKVAWHEMPGNPQFQDPSRREHGVIGRSKLGDRLT